MFEGFEVISKYTRKEAIRDGFLIDLTQWSFEAGFKVHVCATSELVERLAPKEQERANGQDFVGRLWDLLNVLRSECKRNSNTDYIEFYFYMQEVVNGKTENNKVYCSAQIHGGDNGEPCMTIKLNKKS